jgi:hypothetical protein
VTAFFAARRRTARSRSFSVAVRDAAASEAGLGGLLGGDVSREAARVDEPAAVEQDVDVDQDVPEGAVLAAHARLHALHALAPREPREHVRDNAAVLVELGHVAADVVRRGAAEHLQAGAVDAQDRAVGADPVDAHRGVLEEIVQVGFASAQAPLLQAPLGDVHQQARMAAVLRGREGDQHAPVDAVLAVVLLLVRGRRAAGGQLRERPLVRRLVRGGRHVGPAQAARLQVLARAVQQAEERVVRVKDGPLRVGKEDADAGGGLGDTGKGLFARRRLPAQPAVRREVLDLPQAALGPAGLGGQDRALVQDAEVLAVFLLDEVLEGVGADALESGEEGLLDAGFVVRMDLLEPPVAVRAGVLGLMAGEFLQALALDDLVLQVPLVDHGPRRARRQAVALVGAEHFFGQSAVLAGRLLRRGGEAYGGALGAQGLRTEGLHLGAERLQLREELLPRPVGFLRRPGLGTVLVQKTPPKTRLSREETRFRLPMGPDLWAATDDSEERVIIHHLA